MFFSPAEPINQTQARFYGTAKEPTRALLIAEHDAIAHQLTSAGVSVVQIPPAANLPLQFNVRDAAVVVAGQIVFASMARPVRAAEPARVAAALDQAGGLTITSGTVEGGDVMVTPTTVFVGLSERTDEAGYASLRDLLAGSREVVPIRLARGVLHLDVALNLIGPALGVIHPPSMRGGLPSALKGVDWIEVNDGEFAEQAVNVLAIDPGTVILDRRQKRLSAALAARGIRCIPVTLNEVTKVGGGVRCMTLPLLRRPAAVSQDAAQVVDPGPGGVDGLNA